MLTSLVCGSPLPPLPLPHPCLHPALHGHLELLTVPAPILSDFTLFPPWEVLHAFAWVAASALQDTALPFCFSPQYLYTWQPELLVH